MGCRCGSGALPPSDSPAIRATISRSCWTSTIREAPSKVTGPHPNIMRPPTPGSPTPPPYPCLCRADAGILPRFPMMPMWKPDPIASLAALDDVELIDDEVFGSMREFGDGVEEVDASGWYLTQAEEYGRRLHADERRLMYVALTRAREDALMTYCAYTGESGGTRQWCPKALAPLSHPISGLKCMTRSKPVNMRYRLRTVWNGCKPPMPGSPC